MIKNRYQWIKKLGSAPMLILALLFASGIFAAYKINIFPTTVKFFSPVIPSFAIISIICILIGVAFLLRKRIKPLPIALAVFSIIGFLSAQTMLESMYEPEAILPHKYIQGRVKSVEANGANSIALTLEDIYLEGDMRQRIKGKVSLIVYGESSNYLLSRYDVKNSIIKAKADLMFPSSAPECGFYNERLSLLSERISYKTLCHYATIEIVRRERANDFTRFFVNLRDNFDKKVSEFIGGKEAGLLIAVLTGEKSGLDDNIKDNFSKLGTSHLLATSGLHIGVMLLAFAYLLNKLHAPIIVRTIVCSVVIIAFLIFAGFRISMIRAAIMWSVLMTSRIFGRKSSVMNSLGTAMLGMLIVNPFTLFSVSFILSCVSVAAIGIFADAIKLAERFKKAKFLLEGVLVSLAVVVFSWPVTAYYFNNVPILSPIFNLLFVTLVSLALIVGILFGILSWIGFLAPALGVMVKALYKLIIFLSDFAAKYSPQINLVSPPMIVSFLWISGIILLVHLIRKKKKWVNLILPPAMLVVAIIIMVITQMQVKESKDAKIYSDGSSTVVYITQGSQNILILNHDSFIADRIIKKSGRSEIFALIYSGNKVEELSGILENLEGINIKQIYASEDLKGELLDLESDIIGVNREMNLDGYSIRFHEFKAKSKTAKIHYAVSIKKGEESVLYLDPMSLRQGAFKEEFDIIVSSKWSMKRAEGIMNIGFENLYYSSLDAIPDEYILQLEQGGTKTYNITEKATKIFLGGD